MLDSPATKTSVQNGKASTAHTKAERNLMVMARGMIAGRGQPQGGEREHFTNAKLVGER